MTGLSSFCDFHALSTMSEKNAWISHVAYIHLECSPLSCTTNCEKNLVRIDNLYREQTYRQSNSGPRFRITGSVE